MHVYRTLREGVNELLLEYLAVSDDDGVITSVFSDCSYRRFVEFFRHEHGDAVGLGDHARLRRHQHETTATGSIWSGNHECRHQIPADKTSKRFCGDARCPEVGEPMLRQ